MYFLFMSHQKCEDEFHADGCVESCTGDVTTCTLGRVILPSITYSHRMGGFNFKEGHLAFDCFLSSYRCRRSSKVYFELNFLLHHADAVNHQRVTLRSITFIHHTDAVNHQRITLRSITFILHTDAVNHQRFAFHSTAFAP